ncbi:MAG: cysteine--tRNA ligase [Campylobacterota bacterium]
MVIYDSRQKQKLAFKPLEGREVNIYVCGPTVYDDAHLGHARSAVSFDLLKKVLQANHYSVTYASNITDVDDKIIKKAIEKGCSIDDITRQYTQNYFEQMAQLGVDKPDHTPKATQSLQSIWQMIEQLLHSGCAYKTPSGDIYFDTSKDSAYGTVANKNEKEQDTQARVEADSAKKNAKDFALFKADNSRYGFDAPFGKGRPGWHIECSAMIEEVFGKAVDIHGGGADLLFPHHENEAAQTRCARGHEIAKYWMHNGFVRIGGEKMSKSLGNSFYLKDALASYHGEVLRFYLLSSHYRSDFNFNEEDLQACKKRLDKLYRLKKRVHPTTAAKKGEKDFGDMLLQALSDDLNTSKAFAVLDEYIASANEALDKDSTNKGLKKQIAASIEYVQKLLSIGTQDPFEYFQFGLDAAFVQQIETLIEKRTQAKKQKDYETADAIRKELEQKDIHLMDTPNGTVWEKI